MSSRLSLEPPSGQRRSTLAEDVRRGLVARPRSLPPKHFYDAAGSELFDRICDLPEYYLMRREAEILDELAERLIARSGAEALVELGSGAARKTRALLDALVRRSDRPLYVPFDVDEVMLRRSAEALLAAYPTLAIRAIAADYELELDRLPALDGRRRLVAFLGSTIGNFDEAGARALLDDLGRRLRPGEGLLVGFDLVKERAILEAAYDDAAGVTAAFNRNVLRVINRELDGDFDVAAFAHVALFDPARSRIEMYLEATKAMRVRLGALGVTIDLVAGERIHTENSHKLTRAAVDRLLAPTPFRLTVWQTSRDGFFALALAERSA